MTESEFLYSKPKPGDTYIVERFGRKECIFLYSSKFSKAYEFMVLSTGRRFWLTKTERIISKINSRG